MAGKSKISFDKTEIVVTDTTGKQVQMLNLTYDKIISIQFEKCTARKLFKNIDSEKIIMKVRNRLDPIEFYKYKEGAFFDEYKAGLEKFAKDNRISLYNNL